MYIWTEPGKLFPLVSSVYAPNLIVKTKYSGRCVKNKNTDGLRSSSNNTKNNQVFSERSATSPLPSNHKIWCQY